MDNDAIRQAILESLYDIHKKARGRDSQMCGIRDLSQEVKKHISIKEQDVAANVTYLVQNDYVEEMEVQNYYAAGKFGNTKPSYKYRLTRQGLAYFETGSKFDKSNIFAGIVDISGNGNYIIIGNSNNITSLTNTNNSEGHKLAEELRKQVNALGELSDDEKISIQSDLETIKSQLAKKDPDKDIIKKSKENIAFLADIATLAPLALQLFTWLAHNFHF